MRGSLVNDVRHVGASHERSAENHLESDREAKIAPGIKLFRLDVSGDGKVFPRGLQVLADGRHVDVGGAQIAKHGVYVVRGFSQSHHETGLCHKIGTKPPGKAKHLERLSIIRLGPHAAVESRRGLHIMIEHVRTGVENTRDGVMIAAEIGRQHFDAGVGERTSHLPNRIGEMTRSTVVQIVAIDAGDDDVSQSHRRRHASDVGRFVRIEAHILLRRRPLRHRTESAASRAKIPQDHEGRGAPVKALVNIRTARGFAYGVQIQPAQIGLQVVQRIEVCGRFASPFWKPWARWVDLDEHAN